MSASSATATTAANANSANSDDWCSINNNSAITIQPASNYSKNDNNGSHTAILRSLRAAGVKFLRFAIVDAFNTIRCKVVPIDRLMSQLPHRNQRNQRTHSPLENPVSIAEICFAGLPTHGDVAVPSSNLTAKNVLTLHPDLSSLRVLPYAPKTAMVMCSAHNQQTGELSPLCTRGLLERVLETAKNELGVEFCVGAELEFALYHADGASAGEGGAAGVGDAGDAVDFTTFAGTQILNDHEDFITTLYEQLQSQDIPVELLHSESAPGQLELALTYSNNVLQIADDVVLARETVKACAKQYGLKAVFLPKVDGMQAGNGLHLHFSFRDVVAMNSSDNAFSDAEQPTGISERGGHFLEGILQHLPFLLSFSLPTTNSFRRMGPGCWTGHEAKWSVEDKESPLRVCVDLNSRMATNVEYKLSDATANIYLELAMILAAGMEGMKCERTLRPMDRSGGSGSDDGVPVSLPKTLPESLEELKSNDFLLSVLGEELSRAYIAVREAEVEFGKNRTLEDEVADALKRA